MTTNVYYDPDNDDVGKVLRETKCKCGHMLYQHGFVQGYSFNNSPYFRVSLCVMCDCKGFEHENNSMRKNQR